VRWLCHDHIARCNGRNDRIDEQQEGIVPRGENQHAAFGLVMESAFGCGQKEHAVSTFILHPFFQVADSMVDFFDRREYFAKPCFKTRLVKVLPNGFVKLVLVFHHGFAELFQLLNALLGGRLGDFPAI